MSDEIIIPDSEIELTAVRAQGAGGQNVGKVQRGQIKSLRRKVGES